jgi:hypothetical protein
MKRKDIPALLVSAPPLGPGTTPQPQLDRPTAPPAARPSQGGGNFRLEPAVQSLALPVARRPQQLFGQAVGATSVLEAVPSQSSLARAVTGPVLFPALARWAARRAAVRTGEGATPGSSCIPFDYT